MRNDSSTDVEMQNAAPTQWKMYWYDQDKKSQWSVGVPLFKQCKKKKCFFNNTFPDLWYKAPYKYDLLLEAKNISPNTLVELKLLYGDNFEEVKIFGSFSKKKIITKNTNLFHSIKDSQSNNSYCYSNGNTIDVTTLESQPKDSYDRQAHVGPFQIQVCSFKLERPVCMGIYLNVPSGNNHGETKSVCCLVSPTFTIKSKKPRKGGKKTAITKKRTRQSPSTAAKSENDVYMPPVTKKSRPNNMRVQINKPHIPAFVSEKSNTINIYTNNQIIHNTTMTPNTPQTNHMFFNQNPLIKKEGRPRKDSNLEMFSLHQPFILTDYDRKQQLQQQQQEEEDNTNIFDSFTSNTTTTDASLVVQQFVQMDEDSRQAVLKALLGKCSLREKAMMKSIIVEEEEQQSESYASQLALVAKYESNHSFFGDDTKGFGEATKGFGIADYLQ